MDFYTPLFSKVVDSSLWDEPDFVVKVFLTMLAKKDRDQVVRGTAYNIAQWSKKSEAEVLKALVVLAAPDTKRLEPQPHGGRRIERAPDGWLILNGLFYQDLMGTINRRANKAKYERDRRLRIKIAGDTGAVSGKYLEAEGRFVEAHGAGDTAKADAIAAERLPAAPFSEIETVEQCIARTMNAGIPEEFTRYVHADWSSRAGKDAGGVIVSFLPYVTKRWAREQVEWKAGHHKGNGKTGAEPQSRISQEKELDRIVAELKNFAPNLSDYAASSPKRRRMEELRSRRKELQKILGVVA
jgi:hypothetical protein